MSVPPAQYHILAGRTAGTKVTTYDRRIVGAHKALVNMAHAGNHWARECVNCINGLTSRQMKTVFARKGAKTSDNRQVYVLLVPGLRMEFSQYPNSDFVIHRLSLDDTYFELQKNLKRPGLFRVEKGTRGSYMTEAVNQITPKEGRVVTVSEGSNNLRKITIDSARAAKEPIGDSVIDRFGFDMHVTPEEGKLRGMEKIGAKKAKHSRMLRESAILLAKAMEESRKVEGVYWVSQGGGSEVLTQALNLLKANKVSFEGTGHHVFFSKPTTSIVKAQDLAFDLKLKFERRAYSVGMRTYISDTVKAPLHRRRRDPDNYSVLQMSTDMCKGGPQLVIGGVAIASSFGLGGMGGFLIGAGVAGFTAISALTKAVAPDVHNKIKEKL
ncbi:MAG: hypothetical protein WA987_06995 [Cellvibrio sp.]